MTATSTPIRPSRFEVIAIYLVFAAGFARTMASTPDRAHWPGYIALHMAYLALFTIALWRHGLPALALHLTVAVQSAIVLGILALNPKLDMVTALFALSCYQAALLFEGEARWAWVGIILALIAASLVYTQGLLRGLALAMTPMAVGMVLASYVVARNEIERARAASQAMLDRLRETQRQLQAYSEQVEELAAMQERNRLARELHDSVSQSIFSIILDIRSAQILLEREPARVKPLLERLQRLTQDALSQMRSLITQWRPRLD